MAKDLVLETPEGVALRFELAGPGTRILAAAMDALLFTLALAGASLVLTLGGLDVGVALLVSGAVLLLAAYSFLFSYFLGGRTPGKLWTGIRVCDEQGFAPRASQLFLRALFVPLEAVLLVPVPLVWILIATTPRRQRLGDMVAGTLVLRERPRRAPREPAPELSWSTLATRVFPLEPAAARALSGHDLGFLRDLLTRADLEPHARSRLLVGAARHYSARMGLAPREFSREDGRTFLRELFLLLREVRGARALRSAARAGEVTHRHVTDRHVTGRRADAAAIRGATRASGSVRR